MTISIDFFGRMRIITRTGCIRMPITTQSTVADALEYVRGQYPDLPLRDDCVVVTVNHKVARLNQPLRPNDAVTLVPFIGGG
jgi:molybdopterin converting factor small subunit